MTQTSTDRRGFVAGAAAVATTALVVPLVTQSGSTPTTASTLMSNGMQPAVGAPLGAYLKIDTNNVVTVIIGSTEMGQGILSGMAQLAAAELMLDWSKVEAEHSVTTASNVAAMGNPLFGAQVTGGSTSMRGWYLPMRQAAAQARYLLLQAAGQLYGGSWALASGGRVVQGSTYHNFSDLVAKAATILTGLANTVPTQPLQDAGAVIGSKLPRLDIPAKINGSALYGMDIVLPNMVYATTVHCPTLTGTVKSMTVSSTLINLGTAVGVVSTSTWGAFSAANGASSKVTWALPTNTTLLDSTAIFTAGAALLTSTTVTPQIIETAGNATTGLTAAAKKIDATYTLPFLAHGYMEVINCTVSPTYTSGSLTAMELWAPTQAQSYVLPTVAALTGLATSAIKIHTPYIGGGFGRKIEMDYITEAVKIALSVKKPVKLTWSRPQDFTNDKYRPCAQIRVQAGVDSSNKLASLLYRNISPSISQPRAGNPEDTGAVAGAVGLPYAIPNRQIEFLPNPCNIPLGYWRSVGESYNTFAVESAMDELALLAGQDPIAFRLAHLAGDARSTGVLNAVKTLSNWGNPAKGSAQGVAFLSGFGSYIAVVAEVSSQSSSSGSNSSSSSSDSIVKSAATSKTPTPTPTPTTTTITGPRVNKLYVAIDCGTVVNPDSVLSQLQGGLIHGMSAALWHQVTFAAGVPSVSNFNKYRIARLGDVPQIAATIVSSSASPGGVGETGVPCVAPALANAFAKLTGTRIRTLPFFPGSGLSDG